MLRWVVLAFVVVPLTELYLLLLLGSFIGFWPTVGVTLVTGILGGTLAKREGLLVYRQWRRALDELRPPETGIIEGLLVLVGGVFLMTPGVLTDILGLCLLIRPSRAWLAQRIRSRVERHIDVFRVPSASPGGPFGGIDTEGVEVPRSDVVETHGKALPPDDPER